MLGKYSFNKSSVSVEPIMSNEEESKSETSIAITDKSSDDTSDVIFYHRKTLEKRITKSNQTLMSDLKSNAQVQRKL